VAAGLPAPVNDKDFLSNFRRKPGEHFISGHIRLASVRLRVELHPDLPPGENERYFSPIGHFTFPPSHDAITGQVYTKKREKSLNEKGGHEGRLFQDGYLP